jgi:hypothetical protein
MKQKKVVAVQLTDEERKKLIGAARVTWQVIGYDVLTANEGRSMPRDEVIEVTMDADHMLSYGGNGRRLDKVLYEKFNALSERDRMKLMKEAFPLGRYGM